VRQATAADVPTLVALMADFYAEAGYTLERPLAQRAFLALVGDRGLGGAWLIEADGEVAGYVVLTWRFGMEFGGLVACIDDLYVRPPYRNRGLAAGALAALRERCRAQGVRALTVEVAPDNAAAQAVYRRLGLVEVAGRQLLALPLAPPAHAT